MSNKSSNFFEHVYEVVKLIPKGKVCTYGAIANYLGAKGSARMVGWALNQSFTSTYPIPAHRVVNREGLLTGKKHFGGDTMTQLLEKEGIKVENNKIVNLKGVLWFPEEDLSV